MAPEIVPSNLEKYSSLGQTCIYNNRAGFPHRGVAIPRQLRRIAQAFDSLSRSQRSQFKLVTCADRFCFRGAGYPIAVFRLQLVSVVWLFGLFALCAVPFNYREQDSDRGVWPRIESLHCISLNPSSLRRIKLYPSSRHPRSLNPISLHTSSPHPMWLMKSRWTWTPWTTWSPWLHREWCLRRN